MSLLFCIEFVMGKGLKVATVVNVSVDFFIFFPQHNYYRKY